MHKVTEREIFAPVFMFTDEIQGSNTSADQKGNDHCTTLCDVNLR